MTLLEKIVSVGIVTVLMLAALTGYWKVLQNSRWDVREIMSFHDTQLEEALSWSDGGKNSR